MNVSEQKYLFYYYFEEKNIHYISAGGLEKMWLSIKSGRGCKLNDVKPRKIIAVVILLSYTIKVN